MQRHFRDCPLTGPADIPKSTQMDQKRSLRRAELDNSVQASYIRRSLVARDGPK
jgi:hypothetical protein